MRSLFLTLLFFSRLGYGATPELLEATEAFKLSARAAGEGAIEVVYQIAPGYYLYRDKFRFESDAQQIALGAPQIPPGKVKHDEFFGRMETYRGEVRITIPLTRSPDAAGRLTLTAISQGCADVGVCFPRSRNIQRSISTPVPQAMLYRPARLNPRVWPNSRRQQARRNAIYSLFPASAHLSHRRLSQNPTD